MLVRGHEFPHCRRRPFPSGLLTAWPSSSFLTGAPKTHIGGAGVSARQANNRPYTFGLAWYHGPSGPFLELPAFELFGDAFPLWSLAPVSSLGADEGFLWHWPTTPRCQACPHQACRGSAKALQRWRQLLLNTVALPPWQMASHSAITLPCPIMLCFCLPHLLNRVYLRGVSVVQGLPPWFEHLLPAVTPSEPPWHRRKQRGDLSFALERSRVLAFTSRTIFPGACLLGLAQGLNLCPARATTPLGRFCSLPLLGVQPKVLQPLGHAMCHGRVASWQPWQDRKGRFGRHVSRTAGSRRTSCLWSLILGCLPIPRPPSPHVFVGLQAVWVMQANTCAVYGAEAPEDLPLPHETDAPAASPPASTGPQAPRSPGGS